MYQSLKAIGHVGKIESVDKPSGKIAKINLAQTDRWTTKDGERKERTTWLYLTAFGKTAELAAELVEVGKQLFVEARVRNNEYLTQHGDKVNTYDFVIDRFTLLGKAPEQPEFPQGTAAEE